MTAGLPTEGIAGVQHDAWNSRRKQRQRTAEKLMAGRRRGVDPNERGEVC